MNTSKSQRVCYAVTSPAHCVCMSTCQHRVACVPLVSGIGSESLDGNGKDVGENLEIELET